MAEDLKPVFDRIRKLDALAHGSEDGEADLAAVRRDQMLKEHDLTMEEVHLGRRTPPLGSEEWAKELVDSFDSQENLSELVAKLAAWIGRSDIIEQSATDLIVRLDSDADDPVETVKDLRKYLRPLASMIRHDQEVKREVLQMLVVVVLSTSFHRDVRQARQGFDRKTQQEAMADLMRRAQGGPFRSWRSAFGV